jgi:ADP-ribose pyrophosphatase YjhB (NUDIX family)
MFSSPYTNKDKFLVAVDSIILGFRDNELYMLIAKRPFEPMIGEWSLMGGFVDKSESVQTAAKRVVQEYTGIEDIYLEQVGAYGELDRDLGERVISVAYYALVNIENFEKSLAAKYDARWVKLKSLPQLVFDHNRMVRDTINQLQRKAAIKPIGFNLLSELFTLPTLQSLYESIYQESSSRKGAFYYKFNKQKYDQLIEQGMHFSL